jgi:hypothetical protein
MGDDPGGGLCEAESRALRRLAGFMLPSSQEYSVPGADDPAISRISSAPLAEMNRTCARRWPCWAKWLAGTSPQSMRARLRQRR